MGFGTLLLVGWVAVSGAHGQLTGLDAEQWRWVLLTGLLLTAYVATWYAALARAQAIDVTAVLVFGAVVTALLAGAADGDAGERRRHDARRGRRRGDRRCLRFGAAPAEARRRDRAAGALLFARYAYPPNALGLCGADTPRTLLEYGAARASDGGLAELARTFDGAWPYLELIAGANGIADPLDPRVVEAYWVGNALLDRVRPGRARAPRRRALPRPARARRRARRRRRRGRRVPHHCFHVFAVYPWLGLLRTGRRRRAARILDQCRTTPARVLRGRRRDGRRCSRGRSSGTAARCCSAPRSRATCAGATTASPSSRRRQPGDWSRCTGTSSATCSTHRWPQRARAGEAPRARRGGLARLS